MHDLFTRGVDEHGHLRPPYAEAPDLYKESELGWIPREWEVAPLGNCVRSIVVGIVVQTALNSHQYWASGSDGQCCYQRIYVAQESKTLPELGLRHDSRLEVRRWRRSACASNGDVLNLSECTVHGAMSPRYG